MKINKYDKTFSDYIKIRDKFTCQRCGRRYTEDDHQGLHNSHYMGRTNQSTRYDEENGDAMCYGCHSYFEDRKQTAYRDWKVKRMRLKVVEKLEFKSRQIKKWKVGEKDKLRKYYLDKIKQLEQNHGK